MVFGVTWEMPAVAAFCPFSSLWLLLRLSTVVCHEKTRARGMEAVGVTRGSADFDGSLAPAAGDPLGVLKRVAPSDDPPALAFTDHPVLGHWRELAISGCTSRARFRRASTGMTSGSPSCTMFSSVPHDLTRKIWVIERAV